MTRREMLYNRNQAVYSLLANLSIAVENIAQDLYTDNDMRALDLILPLQRARFDISNANHWLVEHPPKTTAPLKREKRSQTPRDFANRNIEKVEFKTPVEIKRPDLAGMKRLG